MSEPKKVKLESKNITEETLEELKRLVPSAFKEGKIDFDALKSVLGDVVEPSREFYNFTWAGKSEAFRTLQRPSTATLRPCKEESKEWDTTENLFIEGDNLEVLKLLQKTYHNSIKMIYIDPPYNKDKDFVYPDRWSEGIKSYKEFCGFVDSDGNITTSEDEAKNATGRKHSRWLTMMYPRLFLARNLLKDDGVILISIDETEAHNLRKICDEIFGEENFGGEIIWKNSSKNDQAYISIQHEYILSYVKNKSSNNGKWEEKKEGLEEIYKAFEGFRKKHNDEWDAIHKEALEWYKQFPESNPISDSKHYNWMDERGVYFPDNISGPNFGQYRYDVLHPVTKKVCKEPASGWRYPEETMKQRIKDGLVHFGKDEGTVPNNKTYIKNTEYQSLTSVKYKDGRVASKALAKLLGGSYFTNPKDYDFLLQLFKALKVDRDAYILDFFAGSGTTAQTTLELNSEDGGNRKFICIQIPEPTRKKKLDGTWEETEAWKAGYKTIAEITKERIRRAGDKVKADNPLFAGDTGFKVFKLDESNFKQWDKEVTDAETLKQQIMEFADNVSPEASKANMLYELLLKKGYNLNAKVESRKIADNEIFAVDGSMLICLDDKISTATIDEVLILRPAHFIVLDRAFEGNDQLKTNTWQTFKTLFPNDENPFETI